MYHQTMSAFGMVIQICYGTMQYKALLIRTLCGHTVKDIHLVKVGGDDGIGDEIIVCHCPEPNKNHEGHCSYCT